MGTTYVVALVGLVATSAALGVALWVKAAARPAVHVVSGNDDPKVVTPGVIPDALARDYARDFIVTLENYVPATLEKQVSFLETRVAPQGFHDFQRLTAGLKRLVKESKQASQLLIQDPGDGEAFRGGERVEVVLRGVRRIYVENALLQEARVAYRVAMVAGEPSRTNPTGLLIAGFSVKLEDREAHVQK